MPVRGISMEMGIPLVEIISIEGKIDEAGSHKVTNRFANIECWSTVLPE